MHSSESESDDCIPIGFDSVSFRQKLQKRQVQKPTTPYDLTYDMLVDHGYKVLKQMREKESSCETMKLNLEVKREGSNKTSVNIVVIANNVNRDVEHVTKYITQETLTSGSINIEGKLLLRGNFTKMQIQDILRKYLEIYVACRGCAKLDTVLEKEKRLWFVKCVKCGSSRTVPNL